MITSQGTFKYYSLPMKPQTPGDLFLYFSSIHVFFLGLRPLEKRDVPGACAMLNKFLQAYHVTVMFTKEEFEHWFLPREVIINYGLFCLLPTFFFAGHYLFVGCGKP
jgi:hypothetical protein